jgi:translocator protein
LSKDNVRSVVNVVATVVMIVVNVLANALPINGQNTGEISDRFIVYFTPAGYVFSIWGIIYLGLIAFAVFQALPAQRANPRLRAIGYWYAAGSVANTLWILLWHYELFPLTVLAMAVLLISLIVCYLRLGIGRLQVSRAEQWAVQVPFSIYLGWITVATVANVTAVLYYLKWNGWGVSNVAWTVIMLAVATVVTLLVDVSRGDVAYAFVIVWAFIGIAVKHSATPVVAYAAWVLAVAVALPLLVTVSKVRAKKTVVTS